VADCRHMARIAPLMSLLETSGSFSNLREAALSEEIGSSLQVWLRQNRLAPQAGDSPLSASCGTPSDQLR
jgi:hypothetical protein